MSACIPSINKPNPTHGYALRRIDGRRVYEHTLAWEQEHGPVPPGMILDHTCHDPAECVGGRTCPHRSCRNAAHLRAVLCAANLSRERQCSPNRRKQKCPAGHPYDDENTRLYRGKRYCRACQAEVNARQSSGGSRPRRASSVS